MTSIVVGVDPSAAGARALQWALREAVSRGAEVTAVRAWIPPDVGMYYPAGSSLGDLAARAGDDARQVAEDQLKLAVEQVPGAEGLTTSAVALPGPAAKVLVEAGKDAALLVVGTRGHGALSRAVLGSVASSVLHHAAVPVVVVPEATLADGDEPSRVLVGVDHSPSSLLALRFAVDVARRTSRTLVPVHVHEPIATGERCVDVASLETSDRRSLKQAAQAAGADGVPVEPEVVTGQAGATLNLMARPQDLLVVGSRGRGGFLGLLLGSTSTQLAQHATCPVAVVRSAKA